MKKLLSLCILILLAISISVAAQASTKINRLSDVGVSLVNQEPDPAEPGKYVDIRFKVENIGLGQVKDFTLELLPGFPFSLDSGVSAVKNLGAMHARQLGDTAIIIKYRVRVNKDAVEGENELKFRYKFDSFAWIEPDPFIINIRTHDAILSIDSIKVTPARPKAGEKAALTISIKNIADSLLKDVKVKLGIGAVPLATSGSSNEKIIKTIKANQRVDVTFDLIVEPDAESDLYKVPIEIRYNDNLGNSYNRNGSFGLIIGSEPDLAIGIDSTTIYTAGKTGEVTVKLVNKGLTGIKFLNVKLAEGNDYSIISPSEVYVGNIDSDDYETTDFKINVGKTKQNKIVLPLTVEYKDANNRNYNINVNLELPIYTLSEAKQFGLVKGRSSTGYFVLIMVVVGGILAYKFWWKKRRKK